MNFLILSLIAAAIVLVAVLIRMLRTISPSAQAEQKVLMAQGYEQMGRSDEALVLYRDAIALDPQSIGARESLCRLLLKKEQLTEAIVCLEFLLALRPDSDATPLQTLTDSVRCLEKKQTDRAMGLLQQLAEKETGSFETGCARILLSSLHS